MTEREAQQLARLRRHCALQTEDDIDVYLDAIEQLRDTEDEQVLREMLLCLRDNDAGEVQYELLEACETFDDQAYVSAIVDVGRELQRVSPQWFELAFHSVLNSPPCRTWAVAAFSTMTASEAAFWRGVVQRMAIANAKYQPVLASFKR